MGTCTQTSSTFGPSPNLGVASGAVGTEGKCTVQLSSYPDKPSFISLGRSGYCRINDWHVQLSLFSFVKCCGGSSFAGGGGPWHASLCFRKCTVCVFVPCGAPRITQWMSKHHCLCRNLCPLLPPDPRWAGTALCRYGSQTPPVELPLH